MRDAQAGDLRGDGGEGGEEIRRALRVVIELGTLAIEAVGGTRLQPLLDRARIGEVEGDGEDDDPVREFIDLTQDTDEGSEDYDADEDYQNSDEDGCNNNKDSREDRLDNL